MTKCLLFDCDGTLIDSETVCNKALSIEFEKSGVQITPVMLQKFRGWELGKIFKNIETEYSCTLPTTIRDDYRATMHSLFDLELQPIKGIKQTLKNLDYPMAIVSSAPPEKIKHGLKICNLDRYFKNRIYSAYDLNIWKPDPRIYTHAASDLGFSAADCFVIEDSIIGVEAGYRAGMTTFFFNRFNEPCPFPNITIFNDMHELPGLIKAHI